MENDLTEISSEMQMRINGVPNHLGRNIEIKA